MHTTRTGHLLLLLLICLIAFGVKAGSYDFWGRHSEVRRAEVSREMIVTGNWAVPHLNGQPFITKPPLSYWAMAWAFSLTGEFDEFSARIPSIVCGTLGVLVTYFWANSLFSARVGLMAGIILATSFLYAGMARTAGTDMMLTFFTTAALACFTTGYLQRERGANLRKRFSPTLLFYLLAAACMGFGTLTKYPIGFAVPLLAVGGFILWTKDFRLIIEAKPWWLLLVFLVVVLPWFMVASERVPDFWDVLYQETLGRYTDPEGTPHHEPFSYYIPALAAFAPWVLYLPGVFMSLIVRKKHQISQAHVFVMIAAVLTFLFFSSVGSKREYYLLPLYPFLAILVAKYWDEYLIFRKTTTNTWIWKGMTLPNLVLAGVFMALGISLPIAAAHYFPQQIVLCFVFGVMFLGCGVALLVLFFRRGKSFHKFGLISGTILLAYIFSLLTIVPEMNVYRSREGFLREAAIIIKDRPVFDYNYESYEVQFYLRRIVPVLTEIEELETLVAEDREESLFFIMPGRHLDRLRNESPELSEHLKPVLARTWTSATEPGRHKRLVLAELKRQD